MTKILLIVFMMMTLTITAGSLLACSSSATLVRKDALGGRVRLRGAYMPAMGDARMLMLERCHGRFEYEELGEAVEFRCHSGGSPLPATGDELAVRMGARGE